MTSLPQGAPLKPKEFRRRVREAFAFLEALGFREESVPSGRNPVAVWFSSAKARVVVEGINWGLNARVALGRAGDKAEFENYDLGDLLAIRGAADPVTAQPGSQAAQLPGLAEALRVHGGDVLAGDFAAFPQLRARVEQRISDFRAERPAP